MKEPAKHEPRFWVIADDNFTSFADEGDEAEYFRNEEAAQERAVNLAIENPGQKFFVAEAVMVTFAPVAQPTTQSINGVTQQRR
jgi:hypothetical protein